MVLYAGGWVSRRRLVPLISPYPVPALLLPVARAAPPLEESLPASMELPLAAPATRWSSLIGSADRLASSPASEDRLSSDPASTDRWMELPESADSMIGRRRPDRPLFV